MTNNMENHVTSLELSKKLKELGVPQKSKFYWDNYENERPELFYVGQIKPSWFLKSETYSAFLASLRISC